MTAPMLLPGLPVQRSEQSTRDALLVVARLDIDIQQDHPVGDLDDSLALIRVWWALLPTSERTDPHATHTAWLAWLDTLERRDRFEAGGIEAYDVVGEVVPDLTSVASRIVADDELAAYERLLAVAGGAA